MLNVLMTQAIERADAAVMEMCTPDKMSKADAIKFLEGVMLNLEGALDALREEEEDDN